MMETKKKVGVERELVFDRSLRDTKHQGYVISDYDLTPADFNDSKERLVYNNFNLSIFIDTFCNSRCPFCIAEIRYEQRTGPYKKEKLLEGEDYFRRLEEILTVAMKFNPSVSITGGEPSISPNLPRVARLLDQYGVRKKVVTSNGTGLFRTMPGEKKPTLDTLVETGFDHLNISRAHWDDPANDLLMRHKTKLGTDRKHLAKILSTIEGTDFKHRMSCVLTKPGVSNLSMMKDYVRNLEEEGANNFIFRELMEFDRNAINETVVEWVEENRIWLNELHPEFNGDPELQEVANILGYYYYVEIFKLGESTVTTESSSLNEQDLEIQRNPDVVYEMVFHENGNLTGTWIDDEDVLDGYNP